MQNKMNKAPAFQFYAGDFLSDIDVQIMTMAQRGIYITLLAHEWIEGSLPTDTRHLNILCGKHPNFNSDWNVVKNCFYEDGGRLYNKRLEAERNNLISYRERMSNNGKKGANARWNGKAMAKPSNKEVENKVNKSKAVKEKVYEDEFESDFWAIYPRRDNKKRAKDKYVKLRNGGVDKSNIINGLKAYIKQWKQAGTESEFIPMASTWLNQERYDDELISSSKVIQNLSIKKSYDWMCIECGKEKTTEVELKTADKLCECGDGYYESKNMVMQQIAINKNTTNKLQPDTKVSGAASNDASSVAIGGSSLTALTDGAGNDDSSDEKSSKLEKEKFDKTFKNLVTSLGAH